MRVDRRTALRMALAAAASVVASGHTPYGQWTVYRKRFLLILTARTDPPSFELGKQVAALLAAELPESKARVSRAPHTARIASLISTKQMDVALMRRDDAAALRAGKDPFQSYGPVPLRTIAGLGDRLLVCRDDFHARHAYLLAETLSRSRERLPAPLRPLAGQAAPPDPRVPLHPGAHAYFTGGPMPAAPPTAEAGEDHDHNAGQRHH